MKIAVFHNLPDGGALRTVYEQIKGLSKKHKIDLYQFNADKYKDIGKFIKNLYVYEFTLDNDLPFIFNRFYRDFKNFLTLRLRHKKMAKDIDRNNYDIVLVHSDKWTESPFILRYLHTTNIYHCHELLRIAYEKSLEFSENVNLINKIYEKFTRVVRKRIDIVNARSADNIITSSKYIKGKVEKVYQKSAKALHTGVDANIFKPIGKRNNQVLFVGGRSDYKGYDTYKRVINNYSDKYRIKFIELGYGDGEIKIGDDSKLARLYSESICTLCLAREEPYGLVPLESMSCKTPVIAINEGGYKETVLDGVTGFLLRRNTRDILKKIKLLVNNISLVNNMGEKGRKHVVKNFSWEKHNTMLEEEMLRIIKEGESKLA